MNGDCYQHEQKCGQSKFRSGSLQQERGFQKCREELFAAREQRGAAVAERYLLTRYRCEVLRFTVGSRGSSDGAARARVAADGRAISGGVGGRGARRAGIARRYGLKFYRMCKWTAIATTIRTRNTASKTRSPMFSQNGGFISTVPWMAQPIQRGRCAKKRQLTAARVRCT
jgi:hypothetical protein